MVVGRYGWVSSFYNSVFYVFIFKWFNNYTGNDPTVSGTDSVSSKQGFFPHSLRSYSKDLSIYSACSTGKEKILLAYRIKLTHINIFYYNFLKYYLLLIPR